MFHFRSIFQPILYPPSLPQQEAEVRDEEALLLKEENELNEMLQAIRNTAAPIPLGLLEGEEEKIITKDDEQDQAEEEEEEELLDDRLLDEGEEEGEGEDVSMFSNLDSIQNSFVNNLDGGQDVFFEVRSPTQTEQNSIIGDEEMEE